MEVVVRGRIRLPALSDLVGWATLKVVAVSALALGGFYGQARAPLYNFYDAMQRIA